MRKGMEAAAEFQEILYHKAPIGAVLGNTVIGDSSIRFPVWAKSEYAKLK